MALQVQIQSNRSFLNFFIYFLKSHAGYFLAWQARLFYIIPLRKTKNIHIADVRILTYADNCTHAGIFRFFIKKSAKASVSQVTMYRHTGVSQFQSVHLS